MKLLSTIFFITLTLTTCKKDLNTENASVAGPTISKDALSPLPWHAVSFVTNYPTISGRMKPYTFLKTQYSDKRIASIKYTQRAWHTSAYEKGAQHNRIYDLKITYGPNKAFITGTRLAYYPQFPNDMSNKTNVSWIVEFNEYGYATKFMHSNRASLVTLSYSGNRLLSFRTTTAGDLGVGGYDHDFYVTTDSKGNITRIRNTVASGGPYGIVDVTYTYNLLSTGKNYLYQTTQYAFNPYFDILELMQWIPLPKNERKTVSMKIQAEYLEASTQKWIPYNIVQSQKYTNHTYDLNKNLVSYTYADNVLQKISWK